MTVGAELERALIGGILLEPAAFAELASIVGTSAFQTAAHRVIFDAMESLTEQGHAPDGASVIDELDRAQKLDTVGGKDFIARLLEETPSASNVLAYAKRLRAAEDCRRVSELFTRAVQDLDAGIRDLPDVLAEVRAEIDGQARESADPPFRRVTLGDLSTVALPPVRFVIEPILPRSFVTLLSGHGDTGKTMLALTIAAHVAVGSTFGELSCVTGRTLFVSVEDGGDLVSLRLHRIAEAFGFNAVDVARGVTVLEVDDGRDAALATEIADSGIRRLVFTKAFDQLREIAAEGFDLIIVDNVSDAFDANENERRTVRRFVREIQGVARKSGAAVLLLAHIDKSGARYGTNGESYSGSTAWHNSVRSRLALSVPNGGPELMHEKSNLARRLEHALKFERNEHGVPIPLSRAEREQAEASDERAVLAAIAGAEAAGIIVPTASTGSRTTVHVLQGRPEIPADLVQRKDRIRDALVSLEHAGRIRRETYQNDDHKTRERFRAASF